MPYFIPYINSVYNNNTGNFSSHTPIIRENSPPVKEQTYLAVAE